jgi:antitoxin (DNA-binding transcriptional repressor) of toxin-antitoxin stability system
MSVINAKQLRQSLPKIVERVRRGERFVVLYRSRPAFEVVPVSGVADAPIRLEDEPLYRAKPVGRSRDGRSAAEHDEILYGKR